MLLSAVAGGAIVSRATACEGSRHLVAAAVYAGSLVSLYAASTLCHGFFLMERVGAVFTALDTAMVNVLIAGHHTQHDQRSPSHA